MATTRQGAGMAIAENHPRTGVRGFNSGGYPLDAAWNVTSLGSCAASAAAPWTEGRGPDLTGTPTAAHHALDDYDQWYDQWQRARNGVMDSIDQLREDTRQHARDLTARCHRLRDAHADDQRPEFWATTYRAAKLKADEAWALDSARRGPIDALHRPIVATGAGRAAYQRAWWLVTGVPFIYPPHEDTPDDHAAGLHYADYLRRSYAGDLPPCSACMDDELWIEQWERRAAWIRNGCRTVSP